MTSKPFTPPKRTPSSKTKILKIAAAQKAARKKP